jgi:hypothetical protein
MYCPGIFKKLKSNTELFNGKYMLLRHIRRIQNFNPMICSEQNTPFTKEYPAIKEYPDAEIYPYPSALGIVLLHENASFHIVVYQQSFSGGLLIQKDSGCTGVSVVFLFPTLALSRSGSWSMFSGPEDHLPQKTLLIAITNLCLLNRSVFYLLKRNFSPGHEKISPFRGKNPPLPFLSQAGIKFW